MGRERNRMLLYEYTDCNFNRDKKKFPTKGSKKGVLARGIKKHY